MDKLLLVLFAIISCAYCNSQSFDHKWSFNAIHDSPEGGIDRGNGVVVDQSGNTYITGNFSANADFDFSPSTYLLSAQEDGMSYANIYLAKYDVNGNFVWAIDVGGSNHDDGSAVTVDNSGNVYITGTFKNTADFDPSGNLASHSSNGMDDLFIAKYDSNGNYLWSIGIGGTSYDKGLDIEVNSNSEVIVTGSFQGTADFDPSTAVATLTSVGGSDIFIAKYDSNGNFIWANGFGGSLEDVGIAFKIDSNSFIYITGTFQSTVDFDPSAATNNLTSSGAKDIFFARYDSNGIHDWAKNIGGSNDDIASGISLDGTGNIYLTGGFQNSADFDPSGGTFNLTSSGSNDVFFASYTSSGNLIGANRIGSTGGDVGMDIFIHNSNEIYLIGTFGQTVDFDPSAGVTSITANNLDAFWAKYTSNGALVWVESLSGTMYQFANAITVDPSGNIRTTGYFGSTVDFDPSSGSSVYTAGGSYDSYLTCYDPSGNYLWGGGIGRYDGYVDFGRKIAMDSAGNIFMVGTFEGTIDVDPSSDTAYFQSEGNSDVLIAKYDANGNYIWAFSFGGIGEDLGTGLVLDDSGNLFVTGIYRNTVDFDPSAGITSLTTSNNSDIYFAKYDSNGNFIWVKGIGSSSMDISNGIVLDSSGNIIIGGHFYLTVDFDPSASTFNLTSAGTYDGFFAKYDVNGNFIWAKSFGTAPNELVFDIALDEMQNIYILGNFWSVTDLDPSVGVSNYTSNGNFDIYIAKYDPSGNFIWANSFGGSGTDLPYDLILDNSNNAYLTGFILDTVDFDPSPSQSVINGNSYGSTFVTKYDFNGHFEWVNGITGTSEVIGHAMDFDAGQNLFVAGNFKGQADFDPTASVFSMNGGDEEDIFISKYDTSGNWLWSDQLAGNSFTTVNTILFDSTNSFVITGTFYGQMDFEPGIGSAVLDADYYGDIFLAKYQECTFSNSVISVTSCIDYVSPSGNYLWNASGTYFDTLVSSTGCDSLITVNLTVNSNNSSISVSDCDDYTSPSGVYTWNIGGIYHDTLVSAFGCDSIIEIDLTLSYSSFGSDAIISCGNYWWPENNTLYSAGGNYTATLTNTFGCDSTATLNLTIITIDTSITANGTVLSANQNGANYQWLDCNNGNTPISGETDQSFSPLLNGNYAVAITVDSCTGVSDCVVINTIGVNEVGFGAGFSTYPNPTEDFVVLVFENEVKNCTVALFDFTGKLVFTLSLDREKAASVDLSDFPAGVYMLVVTGAEECWKEKVMKR